MIEKLIVFLVLMAGPMLALGIYCHILSKCEEEEPKKQIYDDDKRHSGLLEDNDA